MAKYSINGSHCSSGYAYVVYVQFGYGTAYAIEDYRYPMGSSMYQSTEFMSSQGIQIHAPDHELSTLTKWLASRALVVSPGRLLYKAPSRTALVLHLVIENYRLPWHAKLRYRIGVGRSNERLASRLLVWVSAGCFTALCIGNLTFRSRK